MFFTPQKVYHDTMNMIKFYSFKKINSRFCLRTVREGHKKHGRGRPLVIKLINVDTFFHKKMHN